MTDASLLFCSPSVPPIRHIPEIVDQSLELGPKRETCNLVFVKQSFRRNKRTEGELYVDEGNWRMRKELGNNIRRLDSGKLACLRAAILRQFHILAPSLRWVSDGVMEEDH